MLTLSTRYKNNFSPIFIHEISFRARHKLLLCVECVSLLGRLTFNAPIDASGVIKNSEISV